MRVALNVLTLSIEFWMDNSPEKKEFWESTYIFSSISDTVISSTEESNSCTSDPSLTSCDWNCNKCICSKRKPKALAWGKVSGTVLMLCWILSNSALLNPREYEQVEFCQLSIRCRWIWSNIYVRRYSMVSLLFQNCDPRKYTHLVQGSSRFQLQIELIRAKNRVD